MIIPTSVVVFSKNVLLRRRYVVRSFAVKRVLLVAAMDVVPESVVSASGAHVAVLVAIMAPITSVATDQRVLFALKHVLEWMPISVAS